MNSPLVRAALIHLSDSYDRLSANGKPLSMMDDDEALDWIIAMLTRKVQDGDEIYRLPRRDVGGGG